MLRELRDKVTGRSPHAGSGVLRGRATRRVHGTVFREAGIPARAVSGDTRDHDRAAALEDLRHLRVNVLFAADLFNEGLDIPEVDTGPVPATHTECDAVPAAVGPGSAPLLAKSGADGA